MDATEYIKILLDVLVAIVITAVLFVLARRARREQAFVGFRSRSYDEKYAGYSMLVIGVAIIVVSIFELIVILEGGSYAATPFGLSDISIAGQVISGHVLGLSFVISFWLMIFGYGGRKLVSLGMDMLKGKKVTLRRNVKNI
jgi:hypothetical protein